MFGWSAAVVDFEKRSGASGEVRRDVAFRGCEREAWSPEEERACHHLGYFGWYLLAVMWLALLVLWTAMIIDDFRPAVVAKTTRGKQLPVWETPFPAVTICPQFTTRPDTREENYSVMCEGDIPVGEHHDPMHSMDTQTNVFGRNFFNFMGVCKFGSIIECRDMFTKIMTSSGPCFTFNAVNYWSHISSSLRKESVPAAKGWSVDGGYSPLSGKDVFPRRASPMGGRDAGLHVVFTEGFLRRGYCSRLASVKVQVHNPAQVPLMDRDYFTVPINKEVVAEVIPHRIRTDESMRDLPHTRGCYFKDEKKLAYFNIYTEANCQLECLANFTLQTCKCVPDYLPGPDWSPLCSTDERSCYKGAAEKLAKSRLTNDTKQMYKPECDCKRDCNIDKYTTEYAVWTFYWQEVVSNDWASTARLTIYIKENINVDQHEFKVVYHALHGLGDFIFVLSCVSFLMLILLIISVARSKLETETAESALHSLGEGNHEEE